jgi:hypothetical protein
MPSSEAAPRIVAVLKWELAEGERRGETEKQTLKRIAPWFGRASGESMRKLKEKLERKEAPAKQNPPDR